jgi:hypothetical protein
MLTITTNQDFIACEQLSGRYTPHIFTDKTHFHRWMQAQRKRSMVAPTSARGRAQVAIDHRGELVLEAEAPAPVDTWTRLAADNDPARLERARAIVEDHAADPAAGLIRLEILPNGKIPVEALVRIKSQSRAGAYLVDARHCTCPDWPPKGKCKHALAAEAFCAERGIKLGLVLSS